MQRIQQFVTSYFVKDFLEEFLSHPGVGFNGGRVTKKCDVRTLKILFRTGGLYRASTNGLKLVSVQSKMIFFDYDYKSRKMSPRSTLQTFNTYQIL